MIKAPAASTIHAVLDRHGLVKRRKRRRYKAQGTAPAATTISFSMSSKEPPSLGMNRASALRAMR
ncbi:MAG TPA: hypothetical protein VKA43_07525 [Gammaproteobacteria bacterium]|nr:hypothetical protein [Gammaproteobacteria bacterium]